MVKQLVILWNLCLNCYVETFNSVYGLTLFCCYVVERSPCYLQDFVLVVVQQLLIQEPPYWQGQRYVLREPIVCNLFV